MEFLKLARLRAKTHKVARRAASKHAMRLSLQRFVRNFLMLEQPKLLLQRLGGTYPTPWTRMGELFAPRTGAHYILNFSSPREEATGERHRAAPPPGTDFAHLAHLPREQWWDRDGERCLLTGEHVPTPAAWAKHQSSAPFAKALGRLRETKQRMGLAEARLRQALAFYACQHAPLNHSELTEGAVARFFDALALPGKPQWRRFFRAKRKRRRRYPQEPAEFEPWAVEAAEVVRYLKEEAAPSAYPELKPLQAYYVVLVEHVVRRLPFRRDSPLLHHVLDPTLTIVLRRCAWPIRCMFLHYCGHGSLPDGDDEAADPDSGQSEERERGLVHRAVMDLDAVKLFARDFGLMPDLMEEKLLETLHAYVLRSFAAPEPLTLKTLSVRGKHAIPGVTFSAFIELLARCAMFCCPPADKFTQRQAVEELACTFSSPAVGERDRRQAVGTQRKMWHKSEDGTPLAEDSLSYTVPLPERANMHVVAVPGRALAQSAQSGVDVSAGGAPPAARSLSAGRYRGGPAPRPRARPRPRTGNTAQDHDAALQVRYPSRFEGHSRRPRTAAPGYPRGAMGKGQQSLGGALALDADTSRAVWGMPRAEEGTGGDAGSSPLRGSASFARSSGWLGMQGRSREAGPAAYKTLPVGTAPGATLVRGPSQWDVVHEPAASMAVKAAKERDARKATRVHRVGTRAQRDRMLARLGGRALGRLDLQLRSRQRTDGTFVPYPEPAPDALYSYQSKYVEAADPTRRPVSRASSAHRRSGASGPVRHGGPGVAGAAYARGAVARNSSTLLRGSLSQSESSLPNVQFAERKQRAAE